ncbi:short-chain dehydrogenase [Umbelopsis sp. PMI_123]|nr:short-chain dehydrogenase [Umbelopsis sp. PMI_123]
MTSDFGFETTSDEAVTALADQIKGKTILVTGATLGGIGAETARAIAKHQPKLVIVAGRRQEALDDIIRKIKQETPAANLRSLVIDLASFESVHAAADQVNQYEEPIDVLINNAAIMAPPYHTTKDGFEAQFGTNHLGPFLFTALIFNRILASTTGEPRIINVASRGHILCPILFDDYGFSNGEKYNRWHAYGQSKTANMLFSKELAKRYKDKGLVSFSLHPGVIATNLSRDVLETKEQKLARTTYDGILYYSVNSTQQKTIPQGASTTIVAAFDPTIKPYSGSYLQDCRIDNESPRDYALDEFNAEKLWLLSEKLVGKQFP